MRSVPLGADRSRRGAACALQVAEWKADVDRLKKKHTQEVAKARAEWERKLKEAEKQLKKQKAAFAKLQKAQEAIFDEPVAPGTAIIMTVRPRHALGSSTRGPMTTTPHMWHWLTAASV